MEASSYLEEYNSMLAQLQRKKSIFKRQGQNMQITSQQITSIASSLKKDGNHPYAALFCIAYARTEEAIQNPDLQASRLQDAGRLLMQYEIEQAPFQEYQWEEYLADSIQCYLMAVDIYVKNKHNATAARLCREVAISLQTLGKLSDAAQFYDKAGILYKEEAPQTELICMQDSFKCHILNQDVESAYYKIQAIIGRLEKNRPNTGPCANVLETATSEAYISLFLLQITRHYFDLAEESFSLIDKQLRTVSGCDPGVILSLLGAMQHACNTADWDLITELQKELSLLLTPLHSEILALLVSEWDRSIHPSKFMN